MSKSSNPAPSTSIASSQSSTRSSPHARKRTRTSNATSHNLLRKILRRFYSTHDFPFLSPLSPSPPPPPLPFFLIRTLQRHRPHAHHAMQPRPPLTPTRPHASLPILAHTASTGHGISRRPATITCKCVAAEGMNIACHRKAGQYHGVFDEHKKKKKIHNK